MKRCKVCRHLIAEDGQVLHVTTDYGIEEKKEYNLCQKHLKLFVHVMVPRLGIKTALWIFRRYLLRDE